MKTFMKVSAALTMLVASIQPAFADAWVNDVRRMIAAKQTYPRSAQMRGEEGTAKVKITLTSAGKVEKAEVVGTSGSTTLDKEAVALVSRVGNLPAPPAGTTSVVVPLTWKLI